MKKFALVALFAVAVFGMAFAATTKNGSVSISGSDPEVFTLTLPPNYSGTIDSTTQTLFIGNVVVNTNVKDWFLKVLSANPNSTDLVNSGDPNARIRYSITLGSETFDWHDYDPVDGWEIGPLPRTPKGGLTLPFSLIIGPDFYQAGTYSDTITFTIFGN